MKKYPCILKYPIDTVALQTIDVPEECEIISIDTQLGRGLLAVESLFLWILTSVESNEQEIKNTRELRIILVPTGSTLEEKDLHLSKFLTKDRHIGTVHYKHARIVYHVFDATV
jgi:hypothetical protein